MHNTIHIRPGGHGSDGILVDSHDRGPKGRQGDKGDQGDPGEQGIPGNDGVSVVSLMLDENDHLITTMSDGRKIDAGEMPKILTKRVFSAHLNGTTNVIPLMANGMVVEIHPERVSHLLINGITYTSGFRFENGNLILDFAQADIPIGTLEIFTNTHGIVVDGSGAVTSVNGKVGDVEINAEVEPLTEADIEGIIGESREV